MTKNFALAVVLTMAGAAFSQTRAPAGNAQPDVKPTTDTEAAAINPHDAAMASAPAAVMTRAEHDAFADAVDVTAFKDVAVFHGGRRKIVDTLARELILSVYGKPKFKDLESGRAYRPTFTYLDLIFNQGYYADKPLIHVENLNVRRALLSHLPEAERELWLKRGRLTPMMLVRDPQIRAAMMSLQTDVNKLKALNQVGAALQAVQVMPTTAQIISPRPGSDEWMDVFDLHGNVVAGAASAPGAPVAANPEAGAAVLAAYVDLGKAWRAGDAEKVNRLLVELAGLLPQVNPTTYPSETIRQAELIYNKTRRFTISYLAYFASFVILLIAMGMSRKWLLTAGAVLLGLGFAGHTLGLLIRMVIAGRYTIHNQYESYIMFTWFAVLAGIVLLIFKRQWLFGAAAAGLAAVGLLVANTAPIPSADAAPVAPILATSRILYIHVNVIIFSYSLIALGFVVSLFYLAVHLLGRRETLQVAAAGLHDSVEADEDGPKRGRQALLRDLDRAQMVVLQLAFWLLGVGILLGAYWADHSWGRWWGWDPKETWALITWIVYLIVIHVRFTVKRRGLVTAILSVIGFFVMLWTHWGVNLLLPGLHSYA